jgi:hypothetical protein
MTISVYVETKESVPGHLVKFSKAKAQEAVELIIDEVQCIGEASFWVRKKQFHVRAYLKKYEVFLIKNDKCDIHVFTKVKLVKMINEMMGVK